MTTPTLAAIRAAAQTLADTHRTLTAAGIAQQEALSQAVAPVLARFRPFLDAAAADEAAAHDALMALLNASPDAFVRPRSLTVDGVKCGYRKEQDALDIDDEAAVIARIRALADTADLAGVLIRTVETLNLEALGELDGAVLRRLGARRVAGSDQPFIGYVDSDVDKLVKALLADALKRQGDPEAAKSAGPGKVKAKARKAATA